MISSDEVELERRLLRAVLAEQVRQERRDVLRVHLARVVGHERRRIRRPEDRHAFVDDDFVGPGQLAVAAALGREVDDDRARRHAVDHFRGDEDRRLLAGNQRRRDDDVAAGDDLEHHLALAAVERLVLRLGVAALVFRVGRLERHLDEARAQALHLFLDRGADVVRLDPARRAAARSRSPAGRRRRRRR